MWQSPQCLDPVQKILLVWNINVALNLDPAMILYIPVERWLAYPEKQLKASFVLVTICYVYTKKIEIVNNLLLKKLKKTV